MMKASEECRRTVEQWEGIAHKPSRVNNARRGIVLFANGFVERWLGRAHPLTPGVWALPLVGVAVYHTAQKSALAWGTNVVLFLLGILLWTLIEYVLHRFLFHRRNKPTYESKLQSFMMHGYHHEFPKDRYRLVAPLAMAWPLAFGVALLYAALFAGNWAILFAGTLVGYVAYDWIHYYTHHFRPKTRLGKAMRRYHMAHHYKDPSAHYGISSPLWDLVFGTFKCRRAKGSVAPGPSGSLMGESDG